MLIYLYIQIVFLRNDRNGYLKLLKKIIRIVEARIEGDIFYRLLIETEVPVEISGPFIKWVIRNH